MLHRNARALGRETGEAARAAEPDRDGDAAVLPALETFGFEPRPTERGVVLGDRPFRGLAQRHVELVCGMNLCLLDGLLRGLAATGVTAHLDPAPGQCCVRLGPAG